MSPEVCGYSLKSDQAWDLSIPLSFDGKIPKVHHIPAATAKPHRVGDWVGDVNEGGSCNWEEICITPHSHGTHTECVGHITAERISLSSCLPPCLLPATLISIAPREAVGCPDSYLPGKEPGDKFLTKADLQEKLENVDRNFLKALLIRTLPNFQMKRWADHIQNPPAFFSRDAMQFLVELGVEHLLFDLPSVDRTDDGGILCCHRAFWKIKLGKRERSGVGRDHCTITELIYVPEAVKDGAYFLNLQVPHFCSDAAPSRPILIPFA